MGQPGKLQMRRRISRFARAADVAPRAPTCILGTRRVHRIAPYRVDFREWSPGARVEAGWYWNCVRRAVDSVDWMKRDGTYHRTAPAGGGHDGGIEQSPDQPAACGTQSSRTPPRAAPGPPGRRRRRHRLAAHGAGVVAGARLDRGIDAAGNAGRPVGKPVPASDLPRSHDN